MELKGADQFFFAGEHEAITAEIQEFVTGVRLILFSDIVSSTERVADEGDRRWTERLGAHDDAVRRQLERFGGRHVNTTGDGFLATFDGPARAIHCAAALHDTQRRLALPIRIGVHTGEIERRRDDIAGIAVHIAQRISALAESGETLVSRTVTDLVAGSGLQFEERGERDLKGVPGKWAIYAVRS